MSVQTDAFCYGLALLYMDEPFRSQFMQCLEAGAGQQDVHDSPGHAAFKLAIDPAFFEREIGRVALHQRSLVPLLENHVGRARRILDVGCSTGGTTVALALSSVLAADEVIGIDPNARSIAAAPIRARAHRVEDRTRFMQVPPGPLPFADAELDLVVTVSVLEFISTQAARADFIAELKRVVRPGGHVFLSTPSPLRLRDLHSRRLLGDYRKRDGLAWSSPPWQIRRMFEGYEEIPLGRDLVEQGLKRFGFEHAPSIPRRIERVVPLLLRWQKLLVRRPS